MEQEKNKTSKNVHPNNSHLLNNTHNPKSGLMCYRMPLLLFVCISCAILVSINVDAQPKNKFQTLRENILKAASPDSKAIAYKELFLEVGLNEFTELTKDEDTSIALQSAWEIHKKIVKRTKPLTGRSDDIYDRDELGAFLVFLKDRTQAPVPDWWSTCIVDVDVFPHSNHAFLEDHGKIMPQLRESKAEYSVPKGAELELKDNKLVYSEGGKSLEFSKNILEKYECDSYAGMIEKDHSILAAYNVIGGFDFPLFGFETKGGKQIWKAKVWSANRDYHGFALHTMELKEKGNIVYAFGLERNGMYLEAFNIKTGKCLYRFCTCYWFNFSESWNLK
jgi:hypothetical protein